MTDRVIAHCKYGGLKKVSSVLMCVAVYGLGAQTMVLAQNTDVDLEELTVTGIRSSLKRSLDIKRAADNIVDTISAEDAGKFPDANIAESLQRIPGVAIDREGGEGRFITIRGAGADLNTILINGRSVATDTQGREFSFDTFSSSVISRAELYKTPTPQLRSGGIGATVNIVTNRPLDSEPGTRFNFSASGTFDDLSSTTSPDLSTFGNWVNADSTFGLTGSFSYSDRANQRDRVFTNGFQARGGARALFAPEDSVGLTDDDISFLPANARVQQQVVVSRDSQNRERSTLTFGLQARPSNRLEVIVDGAFTEFNVQGVDTVFSGFFDPLYINPVIDQNGTITSFSRPSLDFAARNPGVTTSFAQNDNVLTGFNRDTQVYATGVNVDYQLSNALSVNFDISTSKAESETLTPFLVLGALAPASPLTTASVGEISGLTNIVGAQDTSIQRLHFANVTRDLVDDEIREAKVSFDWEFDRGGLDKISFGAALIDRTKDRDLFDTFSATQGNGIFCAFCGYTVDVDDSIFTPVNLDGFLQGVEGRDSIPTNFLTATFEDAFAFLNSDAAIRDPNRPDAGISDDELIARRNASNSIFGFYEPDRNLNGFRVIDEDISSFFVDTKWNGEAFGNVPWSLYAGVRVARTELVSTGITSPILQIRESVGDTQLSVLRGAPQNVSIRNSYTNVLPSINLRLDIADDKVLRFGASETIARPAIVLLGVDENVGGRSTAPTSTGGNPSLQALEALSFDASFEWYVNDFSFFGVNVFHKEFTNFLEGATLPIARDVIIPAGNLGNPSSEDITLSVDFQDTRARNGEEGRITGVELNMLKTWSNGFGGSLNYTYLNSQVTRNSDFQEVFGCDYNGLSPHVVNLSGFFENDKWSARLSYNYRDAFLVQCFAEQSQPRNREAFGQFDFSASYNINDNLQLFFQGVNIFDEERRDFSIFENRFLEYEDTGPRYTLGIRGTYGR